MGAGWQLRSRLARYDLLSAGAALLFALAASIPSARDVLLSGAALAGIAWLGAQALATDAPGPRARLVMVVALALLVAVPAFLLSADHGLWNGRFPGIAGGLLLWSTGACAIALGARLATASRPRRADDVARPLAPALPRGRRAQAVVLGIVLISLAAFVKKVGGPVSYFHNLNNSAATTSGLTYLIWGISVAKFAAYLRLSEDWAAARRPGPRTIGLVAVALLLLLFLGSRLLLIVGLIQLLLLYAALRPLGQRFKVSLTATAAVAIVAFVVIGELRTWQNIPHHRNFPSYLVNTGLPNLPRTYVNDYADAIRLSAIARRVVPHEAPYENGKEFLRVLLQPLPSQIRPTVATSRGLTAAFTSGNKNGDALPVPVEGYIEFGIPGAVLLSLLLGVVVGVVDRLATRARDLGWLTAAIAAGTGAVIVLRGSLAQGIALALIDVIGFFVTHRILYRTVARGGAVAIAEREPAPAAVAHGTD
jgi:hypothetical protein